MFNMDMAMQSQEIDLSLANIIYSTGFPIQVERLNTEVSFRNQYHENSIEECSFTEKLYNSHIWDEDQKFYQPVKFWVETQVLTNAGLHIAFTDGTAPQIHHGKFEDILSTMNSFKSAYQIDEHYVQRNMLFITLSPRK